MLNILKVISLSGVVILALVCGCTSVTESQAGVNISNDYPPEVAANAEQPTKTPKTPVSIPGDSNTIGLLVGKVWVGSDEGLFARGYYPGEEIEYSIPISNGSDIDKQILLEVYVPGGINNGYTAAPEYMKEWVTISDIKPVIPANSIREIPVTLLMPKDAKVFADKWEFRIRVTETGQGMVKHAVGQRWLITMR